MPHTIDLYWSFRSPYSYLALKQVRAMQAAWDVNINVKIVLPLAVRQADFFETRGPEWMGYLLRDVMRIAQMTDQVISMPQPDPVIMDPKTGTFAVEQPLVTRLTRLGVLAADAGHGVAFVDEVSRLIWSGQNWVEGNALAVAVARAGLDLKALETNMDAGALDVRIAQHDKDLRAAGHWGVPTFVFENEPFFGQDRIDALVWRMRNAGVKKRTSAP